MLIVSRETNERARMAIVSRETKRASDEALRFIMVFCLFERNCVDIDLE